MLFFWQNGAIWWVLDLLLLFFYMSNIIRKHFPNIIEQVCKQYWIIRHGVKLFGWVKKKLKKLCFFMYFGWIYNRILSEKKLKKGGGAPNSDQLGAPYFFFRCTFFHQTKFTTSQKSVWSLLWINFESISLNILLKNWNWVNGMEILQKFQKIAILLNLY